jgi:hypothetical protein
MGANPSRPAIRYATVVSEAEFKRLFAAVTDGEGRPTADTDTAVCMECRRGGDEVTTESRTVGLATLERHTCHRCGSHGITAIEGGVTAADATLWTEGDVQTVEEADR